MLQPFEVGASFLSGVWMRDVTPEVTRGNLTRLKAADRNKVRRKVQKSNPVFRYDWRESCIGWRTIQMMRKNNSFVRECDIRHLTQAQIAEAQRLASGGACACFLSKHFALPKNAAQAIVDSVRPQQVKLGFENAA
jgi:hypothetical protein